MELVHALMSYQTKEEVEDERRAREARLSKEEKDKDVSEKVIIVRAFLFKACIVLRH